MPGHYVEGAIKRRLNASGKGQLSVLVQSFRSLAWSSEFNQSYQTSALWPVKGRTFTATMLRDLGAQTPAFMHRCSSLGQPNGGLLRGCSSKPFTFQYGYTLRARATTFCTEGGEQMTGNIKISTGSSLKNHNGASAVRGE